MLLTAFRGVALCGLRLPKWPQWSEATSAASFVVTVAQHYMPAFQCLLAGPSAFLVLQDSLLVFNHSAAEWHISILDTSKKRCTNAHLLWQQSYHTTNSLPQIWIHPRRCLNPPRLASVVAHDGMAVWPLPGADLLLPHPAGNLESLSSRSCLSWCQPDMCPQPIIEQIVWCCKGLPPYRACAGCHAARAQHQHHSRSHTRHCPRLPGRPC